MVRAFLVVVIISSPLLGVAQNSSDRSSGEIFAMASALNYAGSTNAPGFSLGGAWKSSPDLGVVIDFSRHAVSDGHVSFATLMGGLRLYSGERYRTSGFFHVLLGTQRTAYSTGFGPAPSWGPTIAAGAGVDIRLTDTITFRALQVDLGLSRSPVWPRASSGFVFHFGE